MSSEVLAVGGVRVENRRVVLVENTTGVWLEASTTSTIALTVEEARALARDLYRIARRVERRLEP